jgi:hypothetical protein
VPSGPPAAAAVASAFDFTGSSDDDDDLFSRGARRTDRAAAAATTTARRRRTPAAPPAEAFDRSRRLGVRDMSSLQLSEAQRTRLQELRTDGDRHLMMFLWSQGWKSNEEGGFDLLMHQFEAVRFVAGVPRDWPSAFPISDADRQSLTASWPAGSGGGVLGDIMGLGKTVECLGGVWLRESLHGMRGLPAPLRSSLIVVPNRGVGDQWIEHAVRTGFPRADIAMFGGSKDRLRWKGKTPPRLTITTAYSIQSELRAAFSTFHKTQDGVWTYVPSVLAPHLRYGPCRRRCPPTPATVDTRPATPSPVARVCMYSCAALRQQVTCARSTTPPMVSAWTACSKTALPLQTQCATFSLRTCGAAKSPPTRPRSRG